MGAFTGRMGAKPRDYRRDRRKAAAGEARTAAAAAAGGYRLDDGGVLGGRLR